MAKLHRIVFLSVVLTSLLSFPSAVAVRANDDVNRTIFGIGAGILREVLQGEGQQRQTPTQQPRPTAPQTQQNWPTEETQQIERGPSQAELRAMDLQRNLNALGFDAGPVDGKPGKRTRAAAAAFQQSMGYPATGTLTTMQMVAMRTRVLRVSGGSGEDLRLAEILEAQTYLNELGFNAGTPDGKWGPRSQRALDAFRAENGLFQQSGLLSSPDVLSLYRSVHGVAPLNSGSTLTAATTRPLTTSGPSFDCTKASTSAELAICANPRLGQLDQQLSDAWRVARANISNLEALKVTQRNWIVKRDNCRGDAACLQTLMSARIGELTGSAPEVAAGMQVAGPANTATAVTDNQEWLHLSQGRFLKAPDEFARNLFLLNVKRDPTVLAESSFVESVYLTDQAAITGQDARSVRAAYQSRNVLEREDIINNYRAALIQEAQRAREITQETALPLMIYRRIGQTTYEEGKGVSLGVAPVQNMTARAKEYNSAALSVRLDLPEKTHVPMTREEAKAFLDRAAVARQDGKQLLQIVWGRLTRLGKDETLAEFALQATRGVPTTFLPERVTLHFVPRNNQYTRVPIDPSDPPIYTWDFKGSEAVSEGAQDALALARELGITIRDGSVIPDGSADAWHKLNALAFLGQNPDFGREGDNFALVGVTLMPDRPRRQFFGGRSVDHYGRAGIRSFLNSSSQNVADSLFREEFARFDAKRAFLEQHYDGILARTPRWPLPVLMTHKVRLGEYDFEKQVFPLQTYGLRQGQPIRMVALPATQSGRFRGTGLSSVDRLHNLPTELQVSPDEARELRSSLESGELVLAWWAELDWSADGSEIAKLYGDRTTGGLRPGRAKLKRIALFGDAALSRPVLELDPKSVVMPIPVPEPEPQKVAEEAPKISDAEAFISSIPRVTTPQLLEGIAQGLGAGDDVYRKLAQRQKAVQQANEFDEPRVVKEIVAQMKASAGAPIWIEQRIRLGRYDLGSGTFSFDRKPDSIRMGKGLDGVGLQMKIVGTDPFDALPVAEEVARQIVEAGNRRDISFLMEIEPQAVINKSNGDRHNYEMLVRPKQIVFYRPTRGRKGQPPLLLATRSFEQNNAAEDQRLQRRFEPEDFPGLADARPELDPHMMDLLLVRAANARLSGGLLNAMMLELWRHEQAGASQGARFFDANAYPDGGMPESTELALLQPSFKSYLAAKSQTLGDQFTLRLHKQRQQACENAFEPSSYYAAGTAIDQALGSMHEEVNQLNRRVRQETGAFAVDRRYGFFQQRVSARLRGGCEQWRAFVIVEDVVHEGVQGHDSAAVLIDIKINDIQWFEGNNMVPDLAIRATGGQVRLIGMDGSVSTPIEVLETQPEPVEVASQTEAQDQTDQRAALLAAAQALIEPKAPKTVVSDKSWPEIEPIEVAKSTLDILGIKTGQSMEEAEALILARDGVLAGFELPPSDDVGPLSYQRLYVMRGGTEVLVLGSYSADGPVLGIMRRMSLDKGTLPHDQIAASLRDKYGNPKIQLREAHISGWGGNEDPRCYFFPPKFLELSLLERLDTLKGDWTAEGSGGRPVLGLPSDPQAVMEDPEGCGQVVSYTEEHPEIWQASGFQMHLIDFDGIAKAKAALAEVNDAAKIKIDF